MASMALVRRLFPARPGPGPVLDVAISAVVLAGTVLLLTHGGVAQTDDGRAFDLLGLVLAAWSAAPLIAWRRYPLGVFVVTASAGVLLAGLGYPIDLMPGPAAALFLYAAGRESSTAVQPVPAAVVAGMLVAYLTASAAAHGAFPGSELLHTGLAWAVAWFAGERTRLLRGRNAELRERALRAERDAERERLLAVAEERARIARDLHDSAAHAISLIAVRAGAARLRYGQDPDRSLAALQAVEDLARKTVDEIDQIVGSLRDNRQPNGVEPPAGLASLDTLISHHASTGLRVRVETSGAARMLTGAADQAAYRILQEALTNAARYGTGETRITLTYDTDELELTVVNNLSSERDMSRPTGGHGLIGMRERATLLGGRLDTDRVNGTFRVRARIPIGDDRP